MSASISVINPSTDQVLAVLAPATPGDLEAAVAAARAAAPSWAAEPAGRTKVLESIAALLIEHADELAELLSTEIGVPLRDTKMEVAAAAAFATHRARTPLRVDVVHDDDRQSVVVRRKPIGVVGAILPWNAPLMIMVEKVASAFAVGNTVVVKASPLAPLTVLRVGELVADRVPPGVLSVLVGGTDIGEALVAHSAVGMISFTGSTRAGRAIMAASAPRLKRLSLELGGNDPALVLPGVDVAKVAHKIFLGAFYRSGQICAGIKRVYVPRELHSPMVDALAQIAADTVVGDPFEESVVLGPVSNRMQFERVSALVDDARGAGAKVVAGGAPIGDRGTFYAPTIITNVEPDAAIVAEEQFGPALPVLPYDDLPTAVEAANDTDFGLGASVWGPDPVAAAEIAARLDAGSVWVNRHGIVMPEIPFGGMKQSGVGRANGSVGLDAYSELTTISVALNRSKPSA